MGRIEIKKKTKEETIYQKSFQLFVKKGFEKTTISDIAKASGIAKGTFYLYFKDKYELRDRLIVRTSYGLLDGAWEKLQQESVEGFCNQVCRYVDIVLAYLEKNPNTLRFVEKNLSWGILKDAFIDDHSARGELFVRRMNELMKADGLKAEHPELLLFTIFELVNSTGYSCILGGVPMPLEDYRPYLHRCISQIIGVFTESDG